MQQSTSLQLIGSDRQVTVSLEGSRTYVSAMQMWFSLLQVTADKAMVDERRRKEEAVRPDSDNWCENRHCFECQTGTFDQLQHQNCFIRSSSARDRAKYTEVSA